IQGSAADIMKLAMIKTMPALKEDGRPERMVLTVHDELVFEVPEDVVEEVADRVRVEMEGVIELDAPLKADVSWGSNWAEAK
ncbi:MAG: DNA polymerase, partial [Actinomycetota bacterium]